MQGKAVSTAGKSYTVAEHSTEDYMGILALTQFATFYTCREGARRMKEQVSTCAIQIIYGRILNLVAPYVSRGGAVGSSSSGP